MTTTKALLLALLAASSLTSARVETTHQNGGGNIKLNGPSIISTSTSKLSLGTGRDGSYTYEVDLTQTSTTDTVVSVADVTDSALPAAYQVTVPAGQLSATFEVVAEQPGADILVATSGPNEANMDVLVL